MSLAPEPHFTLELTPAERMSPLWQKLKQHFEQKLTEKRAQNDGPLDPATTATTRGHIAFLKAAIALGDEPFTNG